MASLFSKSNPRPSWKPWWSHPVYHLLGILDGVVGLLLIPFRYDCHFTILFLEWQAKKRVRQLKELRSKEEM